MSNKPEEWRVVALWDAGAFEREAAEFVDAELRRLREVNQELLEALEAALKLIELVMPIDGDVTRKARAAIAKATGGDA